MRRGRGKIFLENVKGAGKEMFTGSKRIDKFLKDYEKLKKSATYKEMYPGGKYVRFQTVAATPEVMDLWFGENGALYLVEMLRFGNNSYKAAHRLRIEFNALEYTNLIKEANNLSTEQNTEILKELDKIANLFTGLSKTARKTLALDFAKVFSHGVNIGTACLAGAGATVAAAGVATNSIASFCMAAGFTHWTPFGAGGPWLALPGVAAAGTVMGWVGVGVSAVALAVLAAKKLYDKYQSYKSHKGDMKILKQMVASLSNIEKLFLALKICVDKYGASNGNLEKNLQVAHAVSDKYLRNSKKNFEKKLDAKKTKNKHKNTTRDKLNFFEKRKKANEMKIEIFRTASNIVLKNQEEFVSKVEAQYEQNLKEFEKNMIPGLRGDKSAAKNLNKGKKTKNTDASKSKISDKGKKKKKISLKNLKTIFRKNKGKK